MLTITQIPSYSFNSASDFYIAPVIVGWFSKPGLGPDNAKVSGVS